MKSDEPDSCWKQNTSPEKVLPTPLLSARHFGLLLAAILLLFSFGCGLMALHLYHKQRREVLEEASRQLEAIADLKVSQLVNWRKERENDAALFFQPVFARRVQDYLSNPAAHPESNPFVILASMQRQGQYEQIVVVDSQRKVRCSFPPSAEVTDPAVFELVNVALHTNQIAFSSLHRVEVTGEIYLDNATPLLVPEASPGAADSPTPEKSGTPVGVVVFRMNAKTYLFPKIRNWPAASRSGETLLVRREGDQVLYLNPLRQGTNAPFSLRCSLAETNVVGVRAVTGAKGTLLGLDYRGIPVLAAVRSVPDRRWLLIAKVDQEEILAPLRESLRTYVLLLAVLILAAGLGTSLVWRTREHRFSVKELKAQRKLAVALRQNADRLASFTAATFEGIIVSVDGRIVDVNDQWLRLLGYERAEAIGQPIVKFVAPESLAAVTKAFESDSEEVYESRSLRKDGEPIDVEARGRVSLWDGRKVRISAIRDISNRKSQERELHRINRLYRLLSKVNDAIVRAQSREELFGQICRAAVEHGGFGMTWLGWRDPGTSRVEVLAHAGEVKGYLDQFEIVLDGRPVSQGAVGLAFQTGQPCVFNDFQAEPRLKPFHHLARARGFQAVGAFPLHFGGAVVGALVVHAFERDFFQAAEVDLLQEVSIDLSYALERLEQEAERQRMDAALRRSENWLRQSQRAARIGSYILDLRAVTWTSSDTLDEILGLDPGFEKKAGSWKKIIHPEDWEEVHAYTQEILAKKRPFQKDFRIRRLSDGQERWVDDRSSLVFNEQGEPTHIQGVIQDITERKRAEDDLRASRKRLMEIIESTTAGYFFIDAGGCYQHVNAAWLRMHGFDSPEEVIGQALAITQTEAGLPAAQALMARVLAGESIQSGEGSRKLKDGSVAHHSLSISPVIHNGQTVGLEGFLIDTTELSRAHDLLVQAQKMEAMGQLVGGVAHDFNNILTAVLIHLGLLKADAQLSPKMKESLGDLEREALRATSLTRQLLLFSRRKVAQVEPLDLDAVVKNLAKMLRRVLGEQIALALADSPGGAWIQADAGMMEQVVMNLCINARDAMANGGQLNVSTALVSLGGDAPKANPKACPGRFVCLTVKDTGSGMKPEVLERIFEPFFTTKGEGKGTGLGLATVYGIVKQHAGWIDVDSAPGLGSTFRVYLPAWAKPSEADTALRPAEKLQGGSETVLFVEDDASLRQLGALWLRRLGYEVLEAGSGPEALPLWQQHQARIKLLLVDLVLPGGIGGLELAEEFGKQAPALQILFSSGYRSERWKDLVQDNRRSKAFLAKPYDATCLAKMVRQCLDQA